MIDNVHQLLVIVPGESRSVSEGGNLSSIDLFLLYFAVSCLLWVNSTMVNDQRPTVQRLILPQNTE